MVRTLLKAALAFGLVFYLVATDKLDFRLLRIYLDHPLLILALLTVWGGGMSVLGALRWNILLQGVGIVVPYSRTLRLHLVGMFFNSVMPGSIGGDLVKAAYILREQEQRALALLTILLDRLCGLSAMFLIGAAAIAFHTNLIQDHVFLRSVSWLVAAAVILILLLCSLTLIRYRGPDPIERILSSKIPGLSFVRKVYQSIRLYHERPRYLLISLALSVVIQSGFFTFVFVIARYLVGPSLEAGPFIALLPIGFLIASIPLAPGGLGVGHLAFANLYAAIGLDNGADIFNVVMLGMMAANLLGVFAYLSYRPAERPRLTG